jgi:hypothetical protein
MAVWESRSGPPLEPVGTVSGRLAAAQGGEYKAEVPEGYYVDFTTIAAGLRLGAPQRPLQLARLVVRHRMVALPKDRGAELVRLHVGGLRRG